VNEGKKTTLHFRNVEQDGGSNTLDFHSRPRRSTEEAPTKGPTGTIPGMHNIQNQHTTVRDEEIQMSKLPSSEINFKFLEQEDFNPQCFLLILS